MDESRRLAQLDFDELAAEYAAAPGVDRAAMFGSSGLRRDGKFFAFVGSGGRLIVKLPADRATALVDGGVGERVTVGGRPTREWVGVPHSGLTGWQALIAEAYTHLGLAARTG